MTIIILFEWNKSTQVLQGLGTVTMSLTYKRTMEIDGKPMKIEIVGTNISTPGVAPAPNGAIGNFNGVPRRYALA